MKSLLKKIVKIEVCLWLMVIGIVLAGAQNNFYAQEKAIEKKNIDETKTEVSVPPSTPSQLVDALNLVFGKQTDNRAVHAKGIVLLGKFTPSATAKTLSKAPHFLQSVPVTIRFSDFTGIPNIADNNPLANPRGLSIKFHLPDGSSTDIVGHSFNGFPAPTADEFRQLLIALGTSGAGAAKPTPLDKYLDNHPVAKYFLESQGPPPDSYATFAYFGVNSFKFTNDKGETVFGRYQFEPQAGIKVLSPDEIKNAAPGYLAEEIRRRVANAPIRFNFKLQLSAPGDKIEDPSIAWSDKNKVVDLGVIEITEVVPDSDATQRALLFLPDLLPDGIAPADPMIKARSNSYPISYDRRHQ
ncbi:MAG: catalase family peroxidase [Acidobacteriota bacterium]